VAIGQRDEVDLFIEVLLETIRDGVKPSEHEGHDGVSEITSC
jgi:hypothetical protein